MKRQKRNKVQRAFSQGYVAGVRGHPDDACPYTSVREARGSWFGGWREGRTQYLAGYMDIHER